MKPISRRSLLTETTFLGSAVAAAAPLAAAPSQNQKQAANDSARKLKIIVTGGHPGDPEYGCGGTIARYTDLGHEVVLLYLNKGEWTDKPGYDPAPIRVAEATKACEILKARPAFAGQIVGKAIVDEQHYEQFPRL